MWCILETLIVGSVGSSIFLKNIALISVIGGIKDYRIIFFQLHAVLGIQQGSQRESSVKTLRFPFSADFFDVLRVE